MNVEDLVRSIGESISASATVKTIYGEPVTAGQRVVIPVAKVRCAFGAGGGSGKRAGDPPQEGGGGGGGGGVVVQPCGLVEVSPEGTRFIHFRDPLVLAGAAIAAGLLLGYLLGGCCGNSEE